MAVRRVKDNFTGEIIEVPDEQLGGYGLTVGDFGQQPNTSTASGAVNTPPSGMPQATNTASQNVTQTTKIPQEDSSFIENLGQDLGENIQGLFSIPGLAIGMAKGEVDAGEVAKQVVSGTIEEYGNLITNPSQSFYEKPISSTLNAIPLVAGAKRLTSLGKAGRVAKKTSVAEQAVAQETGQIIKKAEKADIARPSQSAQTLASNFTVPRKIARWYKPEETMQKMLDYDIPANTIDDYAKASAQITGENGILTNVNRNVLKYVPEIDTSDVIIDVNNFIKKQATLTNADAKQIRQFLPEGTGKQIGFSNADEVWDSMKQLEDQGYQLINSSTDLSPNLRNEQLGRAYLQAADELELSISNAVAKSGALNLFKSPEIIGYLEKISPKLAKEYQNATSYRDIRTLQAPFVRLQKMQEISENDASSAFSRLAQATNRGKGLGIINQVPGAESLIGRPFRSLGERLSVKSAQMTNTPQASLVTDAARTAMKGIGKAIKQPVTYILSSEIPQEEASTQEQVQYVPPEQLTAQQGQEQQLAQQTITGYTIDELRSARAAALLDGEKAAAKELEELIELETEGINGEGGASKQTTQRANSALTAMAGLQKIDESIRQNTGTPKAIETTAKLNATGGIGRPFIGGKDEVALADLESKYFIMTQSALTAIQGSRPSDYDAKQYQARLGPSIMNTPEVNQKRVETLQSQMLSILQNPNAYSAEEQRAASSVMQQQY